MKGTKIAKSPQITLLQAMATPGIVAPKLVAALYKERIGTEPRDRDGYISPSSILGCETFAVRQLRGEPRVHVGSPWTLLPDTGTYIHGALQDIAVAAGLLDPRNRELFVELPDLKIKGSVDGVLDFTPFEDLRRLLGILYAHWEIKTVGGRDLSTVERTNQPLEKHKPQAVCYQMCLGLGHTVFSYVGREFCSEPTDVLFAYDKDIADRIVDWCQRVIRSSEVGDYSKNVWGTAKCNTCRYFPLCEKTFRR